MNYKIIEDFIEKPENMVESFSTLEKPEKHSIPNYKIKYKNDNDHTKIDTNRGTIRRVDGYDELTLECTDLIDEDDITQIEYNNWMKDKSDNRKISCRDIFSISIDGYNSEDYIHYKDACVECGGGIEVPIPTIKNNNFEKPNPNTTPNPNITLNPSPNPDTTPNTTPNPNTKFTPNPSGSGSKPNITISPDNDDILGISKYLFIFLVIFFILGIVGIFLL